MTGIVFAIIKPNGEEQERSPSVEIADLTFGQLIDSVFGEPDGTATGIEKTGPRDGLKAELVCLDCDNRIEPWQECPVHPHGGARMVFSKEITDMKTVDFAKLDHAYWKEPEMHAFLVLAALIIRKLRDNLGPSPLEAAHALVLAKVVEGLN